MLSVFVCLCIIVGNSTNSQHKKHQQAKTQQPFSTWLCECCRHSSAATANLAWQYCSEQESTISGQVQWWIHLPIWWPPNNTFSIAGLMKATMTQQKHHQCWSHCEWKHYHSLFHVWMSDDTRIGDPTSPAPPLVAISDEKKHILWHDWLVKSNWFHYHPSVLHFMLLNKNHNILKKCSVHWMQDLDTYGTTRELSSELSSYKTAAVNLEL